ncbi:MAG: hypothetical protein AAFZ18_00550 [Myxococcota bacterium]
MVTRRVTIHTPKDPADKTTKVELSTDGTDVYVTIVADPDPSLAPDARKVKLGAADLRASIEALEDMETLTSTSAAPKRAPPTRTSWMPKLPPSWTQPPTARKPTTPATQPVAAKPVAAAPRAPAAPKPKPAPAPVATSRPTARGRSVGWDPYDVGDTL